MNIGMKTGMKTKGGAAASKQGLRQLDLFIVVFARSYSSERDTNPVTLDVANGPYNTVGGWGVLGYESRYENGMNNV